MRKPKLPRLLIVVLICGGLFSMMFVEVHGAREGAGWPITISDNRIRPEEVTYSNLEMFKAQVRRDLPIGTPKSHVERYLIRRKIGYFYADSDGTVLGNAFYGTIKGIGTLSIFTANLAIRIFLDADGKVREIVFRVDYR